MGPQPANPQQIQQFLSSVLSQRGPSSLPYTEDTKWLIRQQLLNLISAYPSLEPKTATFTHNDGRSVNLLQTEGTVPMLFQGVTYNIPIIIWLLESYPRHPPCVYVNPTRDMIIKRPHSHVTPSGSVSIPYLQNWVYPSSNLVDLVRELSAAFARDPPLFSQRRPTQNPTHQSSSSSSIGSSYGSGYGSTPRPTPPARGYPHSPYQQQHHPQHSATDEAAEVFKRNAVNKIVEMVHGDLAGMRKTREAETEGLLSAQAVSRRREDEINKGLKEMQDEKEGLEEQLQVVLMNTAVLESWVKDNEEKKMKTTQHLADGFDIDNAFECVDSLSKQMLECTAADLGVEDLVYALDKAVQDGAVPFDQYLRNVRLLSREQFFHRATASKVRAAQMQAQVATMAARSQQHYVL